MSSRNLLDQIQIKSPCSADWNSMIGNDQIRFCEHCNLSVQDISQMTRKRVLRLAAHSKGRLCIRYQRRPDGSLVTKSVGQKLHQISRRASRIAAGAFSATLSISSAVAQPTTLQWDSNSISVAEPRPGAFPASQSVLSASIMGRITDQNGAVISGAGITLGNAQTSYLAGTMTNGAGEYRFEGLQPGDYRLTIEAFGFGKREVLGVVLSDNGSQRIDQMLEVASIQETVEIEGGESNNTQNVILGGAMVVMVEPSEPLVKAAQDDDLQALEALLTRNNVNVRDKSIGTTALEHAVRNGDREMVQVLLAAGADVNSMNDAKETALMMLGEEASADIVWDLINAGGKVNLKDEEGSTALIEAAIVKNVGVLNALLHAGAKVDARNDEGQTALMLAASNGQLANLRALIRAGADMNAQDKDRKTVLDHARENDHEKVVKLLQSYGAIKAIADEDKAPDDH